jgi:hypothetical protein
MKKIITTILILSCVILTALAGDLTAETQAKINAKLKIFQEWGKDARIVDAVKVYNVSPSAEAKAMTNEKWKTLTILNPFVRSLIRNDLGEYLKSLKTDAISELFISGADGGKVAFLTQPTNWNHTGKEKHDAPMNGKTWQGKLEMDESTGAQQLQVSVPVLAGEKPIGSIVVGLNLSKL